MTIIEEVLTVNIDELQAKEAHQSPLVVFIDEHAIPVEQPEISLNEELT